MVLVPVGKRLVVSWQMREHPYGIRTILPLVLRDAAKEDAASRESLVEAALRCEVEADIAAREAARQAKEMMRSRPHPSCVASYDGECVGSRWPGKKQSCDKGSGTRSHWACDDHGWLDGERGGDACHDDHDCPWDDCGRDDHAGPVSIVVGCVEHSDAIAKAVALSSEAVGPHVLGAPHGERARSCME